MLRRKLPPALLLVSLAVPASAQEETTARPLSLGDALQVATRSSPTLERATIDVEIADASVLEAAGIEDWVLAASGNVFLRRDRAVAGDVTGTNKVDQYSLEASLARLLPTGGAFSISASGNRTDQIFAFVGEETTRYTTDVALSLNQPLLRDRGSEVTLASVTNAELERDAAELARETEARRTIREVVQSYWRVALARRTVEIRESSLELAREQLRRTRAGIDIGSIAPTEALAVEQVIATREEEILGARLQVTERSLDLRRLLGMDIGPRKLDVKTTQPLVVEPRALDLDEILARALESSPELAELRTRGEQATLTVEVTDNGLLPRLDLSVNAGPLGTAEDLETSTKNLAEFRGWALGATLSYEQPIENRAARGAHERARSRLRRVRVDEADLRRQIATAVVRAVRSAQAAEERIEISRRVIELAEKNIEAEEGRFELGRSTNFDVLQRQTELEQARLRLAQASVDYLSNLAIIGELTGDILPRYGVELDAVSGGR